MLIIPSRAQQRNPKRDLTLKFTIINLFLDVNAKSSLTNERIDWNSTKCLLQGEIHQEQQNKRKDKTLDVQDQKKEQSLCLLKNEKKNVMNLSQMGRRRRKSSISNHKFAMKSNYYYHREESISLNHLVETLAHLHFSLDSNDVGEREQI
jgi:hypothetical protein